jgi:hypothetical protein
VTHQSSVISYQLSVIGDWINPFIQNLQSGDKEESLLLNSCTDVAMQRLYVLNS